MEYLIKTGVLGMTEEQFFDFCQENDYLKLERNAMGDIILMEPTGTYAASYNFNIYAKLFQWNEEGKFGMFFDSNAGFTLPNKAVRSPDCAFIRMDRWKALPTDERHKFAHICPDFVIELRSSKDNRKKLEEKMIEWMNNGCKLAWLIDPKRKETVVYSAVKEEQIIFPFNTILTGEDVLPGFKLDLTTIFKDED
jgi:Uma2 family endonuclease